MPATKTGTLFSKPPRYQTYLQVLLIYVNSFYSELVQASYMLQLKYSSLSIPPQTIPVFPFSVFISCSSLVCSLYFFF